MTVVSCLIFSYLTLCYPFICCNVKTNEVEVGCEYERREVTGVYTVEGKSFTLRRETRKGRDKVLQEERGRRSLWGLERTDSMLRFSKRGLKLKD